MNSHSSLEIDLKSISILWESNNYKIRRGLVLNLLSRIPNGSDPKKIELIVFYCAIQFRFEKLHGFFVSVKGLFKSIKKLSFMLSYCNEKLDNLKMKEISDDLFILDVLTSNVNSLMNRFSDINNLNAAKKLLESLGNKHLLESYEYIIFQRLWSAINKKIYYDSSRKLLNNVFKNVLKSTTTFKSLPDEILTNILYYLSIRDLKKICGIHSEMINSLYLDWYC